MSGDFARGGGYIDVAGALRSRAAASDSDPASVRLLTRPLQALIDRASERGGGTLVFGPGTWRTGALVLRDDVGLRLEHGARLVASADPADFPVRAQRWEGRTVPVHAPLIGAEGARRISVTGPGLVDGSGESWWTAFREGTLDFPRPRLVAFQDCRDVLLEGFTAVDSPSWTVNPVRCERVEIRGIRIENPPDSPNTDGIDPDSCRDVRISGCSISAGDDCIAVKSGTEDEEPRLRPASELIVITGCVFEAGHGGVVLGSEMSGGIRDVVVSACAFRGTDRGIRVKTRRGRGGSVEGAVFSDLAMRDVPVPVAVNCYYGCGAWGDPVVADKGRRPPDSGTPGVSRLRFAALQARGARYCAAFLYGLPESPLEALSFSDCDFELDPDWTEAGQPEMGDGLPDFGRAGFFARNVRDLELRSVRIRGHRGPEFDLGEPEPT